jgi:hypothetical protein
MLLGHSERGGECWYSLVREPATLPNLEPEEFRWNRIWKRP